MIRSNVCTRPSSSFLRLLLTFVGLALLLFAQWIQHVHGWHWISLWPIGDIGSGIFTTGLLGVG